MLRYNRLEYTEGLGYRSLPPPLEIPGCRNCGAKGFQAFEIDEGAVPIGEVGFKFHGHLFHVCDFCLFYTDEPGLPGSPGLARIGQILSFNVQRGQLELREYGRIADFALPVDKIERSWDDVSFSRCCVEEH